MGFTSLEGEVRRRWKRVAQLGIDSEELRSLRIAIAVVCETPHDPIARTRLHTLTADVRTCEQLAPLLAAEARLAEEPDVVAALDDELLRTRARIEPGPPPIETLRAAIERDPENPSHHEQLAWAYYLAGVWRRAAEVLEQLASLLPPEQAILPLHAAAKLYRNTGYTQRSRDAYRAVVVRKPSNTAALIALGELISEPARPPHRSPFDPPGGEPVEWPALPTVADPDLGAVAPLEPVPSTRTRKRMQVLDRIDDAELEQRFAAVFDEDGSFERRTEAPAASITVPGPVGGDDDGEVLEISEHEPEPAARDTASMLEGRDPDAEVRFAATRRLAVTRHTTPAPQTRRRELTPASDPHAAITRQITVLPDEQLGTMGDAHHAVTRPIAIEIPPEARPVPPDSRPLAVIRLQPAGSLATREPGERSSEAIDRPEPPARAPRMRQPSELFAPPPEASDRIQRLREASERPPFVPAPRTPSDRPPTAEGSVRTREPSDRRLSRISIPAMRDVEPLAPDARESRPIIDVEDLLDAIEQPDTDGDAATRESKQIITLEDFPAAPGASAIEAAGTEARAGRVVAAEQRLRAALAERPLETQVHLSLVDLLRANARLDDADRHLRDALFEAPVRASAHRAALLHRHALVTAARGDRDAAHAMLRTAHQHDPMNLIVELALGESYFTREAWTDAALHLGALATHRDAGRHSRQVAEGLVSAAQAELRLRRPANAIRHYQAALRIDPTCEPARRALALKSR
ncbi:MAG: hypothetical protein WKG01_03885 [Kofleriaceae bacterium]